MMIWIDLETTGLDEDVPSAYPLEIAVVLTDDELNVSAQWTGILKFERSPFDDLDERVIEMHENNGLWDLCASDSAWKSTTAVDDALVEWFDQLDLDEKPVLAGSTISFDRAWLRRFFPKFHAKLHYRNIDVSTIKELTRRWNPPIHKHYQMTAPEMKPHRALHDVYESISELALYKDMLFDEVQAGYMGDWR